MCTPFRFYQVRYILLGYNRGLNLPSNLSRLQISLFPAYQELLRIGRERPGALFLDLGCAC